MRSFEKKCFFFFTNKPSTVTPFATWFPDAIDEIVIVADSSVAPSYQNEFSNVWSVPNYDEHRGGPSILTS